MPNRFGKVGVVVIILLVVAVTMVGAAGLYTSAASGSRNGLGAWDSTYVEVNATGSGGTCTLHDSTAFYQWGLSSISDAVTIGSVSISTPVTFASIPTASIVTLYGTTDDTWPPTVAGLAGALSTATLAQGATTLTFPTSPALVTYVQQALADNTANFGIRWSTCNQATGVIVADFGLTAQLALVGTNSVELSGLSAQAGQVVNWPLIVGLAALALMIVGLSFYRRLAVAR
jgi:hypothetical protein